MLGWRSTLKALRNRESTIKALRNRESTTRRFKTCSLKVFNYDEDGNKTRKPEYLLYDKDITLILPLFRQITKVLPFDEWEILFYYEVGHPLLHELLYEQKYRLNDPDYEQHIKTLLDTYCAKKINECPQKICLELHKRFPS